MEGCLIKISGNWAHFKKPETNNNPLTHDFITKTALIGMMGAVMGIDRMTMKTLFPILSCNLKYGLVVTNEVVKESWGFTYRSVTDLYYKVPKQMEFIRNPSYLVALVLANKDSIKEFNNFKDRVSNSEAIYTPVLGIHNCPANIEFIGEGIFEERSGAFRTLGIITNDMEIEFENNMRIGFERIPTFQNDDFWNLPDRYIEVVYPSNGNSLSVQKGNYYQCTLDDSSWVLL